jgi:hypothetical protein
MEEARSRMKKHVLWPNVSDAIEHSKTVFHADLQQAVMNGKIKDKFHEEKPAIGWALTINGEDREAYPLTVFLFVPDDESMPAEITGFTPDYCWVSPAPNRN